MVFACICQLLGVVRKFVSMPLILTHGSNALSRIDYKDNCAIYRGMFHDIYCCRDR